MKLKYCIFMLMTLLLSCSNDDESKSKSKLTNDSNNQAISSDSNQAESKLVDANQAQISLNKAIQSLKNVPQEFHWRDTHLLIKRSQTALNEGQIELSLKLSQDAIKQSQLMIEQKEFAKNNWQNLIPKIAD